MSEDLHLRAINLLQEIIRIPSFSGEEAAVCQLIRTYLEDHGVAVNQKGNNLYAFNKSYESGKPTILLNSHHDTVKPNKGYIRDPFQPDIIDGKLYGLGSNDAGGALVSLIHAFLHFYEKVDMGFNLVLAATAEEETSGVGGIESILDSIGPVACGIVGEPTLLDMAIAEKGLLVVDATARGRSGHAAREEGENSLYKALDDIRWLREYEFPKTSEWLGPVKMQATMIGAGTQHNVVPDTCNFTIDIRVTDQYTHEEIMATLKANMKSELHPRSMRLRASAIDQNHPLVQAGAKVGCRLYGSPTTSDMALIPYPTVKLGPGNSARSHTADEYIWVEEIRKGIERYINVLLKFV